MSEVKNRNHIKKFYTWTYLTVYRRWLHTPVFTWPSICTCPLSSVLLSSALLGAGEPSCTVVVHEGTYCYVPVITSDNRADEQHVGRGKQVSLLSQTSDWSPSCVSRLKQSHRRQRRFVRVSIKQGFEQIQSLAVSRGKVREGTRPQTDGCKPWTWGVGRWGTRALESAPREDNSGESCISPLSSRTRRTCELSWHYSCTCCMIEVPAPLPLLPSQSIFPSIKI